MDVLIISLAIIYPLLVIGTSISGWNINWSGAQQDYSSIPYLIPIIVARMSRSNIP